MVSPTNKIVIEYPEPRLILTGVRDNFTGEYDSYVKMLTYRDKYPGLYIVAAYSPPATNFKEFMKTTKELQDQEGFVVRFLDGQMVKAKGDWYLKNHKSEDLVSKEHNVVRMILDESVDDILPSLTNDDIKYIEDLTKRLEVRLESSMLNLKLYIDRVIEQYGSDRKAIGLSDLKDKSAIFSYLNGQSVREIVVSGFKKWPIKKALGRNCRSQKLQMIDYINEVQTMLQGYEFTAGVSRTRWNNALKRCRFTPSDSLLEIVRFFDNLMASKTVIKSEYASLAYSVINKFTNEVICYILNSVATELKIPTNNLKALTDLIKSDLKGKLEHKAVEYEILK